MPRHGILAGLVVALLLCTAVQGADRVYWVDWTSGDAGAGSASGVITVPTASGSLEQIGLTFTSKDIASGDNVPVLGVQTQCGTNYWQPDAPYVSSEYSNGPDSCDLIQLVGGTNTRYAIKFSAPVQDPVMAVLSLGSSWDPATYAFSRPYTLIPASTTNAGYWGGNYLMFSRPDPYTLVGSEGHGLIRFDGTFDEFSWTALDGENWHGFTLAVRTTASLDCVTTDWVDASACSVACGYGTVTQTRTLITPGTGAGTSCPLTRAFQCFHDCSAGCSAIDLPAEQAVLSQTGSSVGSSAVVINAHCAAGTTSAQDVISCQPSGSWSAVLTPACDGDCVQSAWVDSGACRQTARGWVQDQTRAITRPASGAGKVCEAAQQTVACAAVCPALPLDPSLSVVSGASTAAPVGSVVSVQVASCARGSSSTAHAVCQPTLEWSREEAPICSADCELSAAYYSTGECTPDAQMSTGYGQTQVQTVLQPAIGAGTCAAVPRTIPCTLSCPSLELPEGTLLVADGGNAEGAVKQLRASCAAGTTSSEGSATCLRNSADGLTLQWSYVAPTCDADCQLGAWATAGACAFSVASNAYVERQVNSVVVAPVGAGAACGPRQQFVPCVGTCAALSAPSGLVLVSGVTAGARAGDIATYQPSACPAHTTAASSTITCRAVGQSRELLWSALVQPTCDADCQLGAWNSTGACAYDSASDAYLQRQTRPVVVQPAGAGAACLPRVQAVPCSGSCGDFVPASSALISGPRTGSASGATIAVTRQCAAGYTSNVTQAVCAQHRAGSKLLTWSKPALPVCAANPCAEQLSIANGAVSAGGRGSTGSSVVFSCSSGYVLSESVATWTCAASGEWSSALASSRPRCVASACPSLQAPANGYLTTRSEPNNLVVDFNCVPGFALSPQHDTYRCHLKTGKLTPADQPSHPFPTCARASAAASGAARRLLAKMVP